MTKEAQTVSAEIKRSEGKPIDPVKQRYQNLRIIHWDRVSPQKENARRVGAFYQKLLQHYYKFLIPPKMRVELMELCLL